MKKELLVLLMIVSSAVLLSAEGKQDDDIQFYGRGPGMMGGNRFSDEEIAEFREEREAARAEYLESLESVSITGPLSLVNGELPLIESNGIKYTIMAPWYNLGDLDLTDGMEVTVEGYEMPGRPLVWDGSEKTLMVTRAIINGEEIIVEHPMDGAGFRGGFGGNGGAYGCGLGGSPYGGGRKGGNRGSGFMGRRF